MTEKLQKTEAPAPIAYRPDIDGLRALAVIAVIAFHAFPSVVQGGYVGVDVFFVISGFLISSILIKNIDRHKFSIIDFYFRRIKRIFPALMLVLAITLCMGWTIMLSDEFKRLGQHTAAATLFGSNFWLWHEAGYFDPSSDLKPLLHLWSLAIEEQFYIVWPLLLFLLYKMTRHISFFIFLIAIASLISCISHIENHVSMFYFPQNRAWELLIGAFLASLQSNSLQESRHEKLLNSIFTGHVFSCLGTLLVLLAIFTLDKTSVFPGWWALLPTLGAAMIIAAGERSWINRHCLSNRVMVFIGLISYPLYLWHWPLLAFARIMENGEPSAFIRSTSVVVSALLSWLTYRFLELPLRHGGKRVIASLITAAIAIGTIGYLCGNATIKSRATFYNLETIMNACEDWGYAKDAIIPLQYNDLILESQGTAQETTIFIGDSNMQQYLPRINQTLINNPQTSNRAIFAVKGACTPIPNIEYSIESMKDCTQLINSAYAIALNDPRIDTVVIAAAWDSYLGNAQSTARIYNKYGSLYPLSGKNSDGEAMALEELERTIYELQKANKRVFLILNIPRGNEFDPRGLITRSWKNLGFGVSRNYTGVPTKKIITELEPAVSKLKDIAQRTGITVFDPVEIICNQESCPVLTANGLPIYKDNNHLNATFVKNNLSFLDKTVIKR